MYIDQSILQKWFALHPNIQFFNNGGEKSYCNYIRYTLKTVSIFSSNAISFFWSALSLSRASILRRLGIQAAHSIFWFMRLKSSINGADTIITKNNNNKGPGS